MKLTLRRRFTDLVKSIVPPARADYQDFYDKFMIDAYALFSRFFLCSRLISNRKTWSRFQSPSVQSCVWKGLRGAVVG